MGNSYFSFKQFTIQQQHCAMKVCTDACLFGAWLSNQLTQTTVSHILDIGTGTGLLPLILAQQTTATIHTVEVDHAAFTQAQQNFADANRSQQINVYHQPIQQFYPGSQYPFILSNPPFYQHDLKGPGIQKNLAHHSTQLSINDLLTSIQRLLQPNGSFALLLPARRAQAIIDLAGQQGYHPTQIVRVKQTERHYPFRWMVWFATQPSTIVESEITIKVNNTYSAGFTALLKNYYLHL